MTASQEIQVVTFEIERELYGVNTLQLDEIIPIMEIKPIPRGPKFLEGIINLRGEIVPIIDLKKQFGYPRPHFYFENRILVTQVQAKKIGFIVDAVKEVRTVVPEKVSPPVIQSPQARFLEGVIKMESGQMIQIIAVDKILKDDTIHHLENLNIETDQHHAGHGNQ